MISYKHHGFVTSRSTVSNLINKTQFISEKLAKLDQVDVIYTDFMEAFAR